MYHNAFKKRNSTDDFMVSQLDYGREKSKKESQIPEKPITITRKAIPKKETKGQKALRESPFHTCEYCGKNIPKGKSRDLKAYKKKRFCNPACSNRYHRGEVERQNRPVENEKICIVCGKKYPRKEGMTNYEWGKRKVCGKRCTGVKPPKVRQTVAEGPKSVKPTKDSTPIDLTDKVPESKWEILSQSLKAYGASEKTIAVPYKYYGMGFRHGQEQTRD